MCRLTSTMVQIQLELLFTSTLEDHANACQLVLLTFFIVFYCNIKCHMHEVVNDAVLICRTKTMSMCSWPAAYQLTLEIQF